MEPAPSLWTYTGWARIHFNRKDEAPLFASITSLDRTWEVLACQVIIEGALLVSASNPDAKPGIEPIWWLEGDVRIELYPDGVARVYPAKT